MLSTLKQVMELVDCYGKKLSVVSEVYSGSSQVPMIDFFCEDSLRCSGYFHKKCPIIDN